MGIKSEKTFEEVVERLVAAVGIRIGREPDGADAAGTPPETAPPAPEAAHDILPVPVPALPADD
jgi:hypothetical protein